MADDLLEAARAHLVRWPTTSAGLRDALIRRLCRTGDCEPDELDVAQHAAVDEAIARLQSTGELDDDAWAADRVARLRARGKSGHAIRADLAGRGIDHGTIDRLLDAPPDDADDAEPVDADWLAACRLARRRGLGPFRDDDARAARRERDLGVLARGGFGRDLARRLVDDADRDEVLDLLERHR